MEPILGGLLVFCLRLTDVTLGTLRILMTVRGRKLLAALIGFIEVTIFVVAISRVVRNVGNVWNVLGYSGGFACGTLVGMTIEEHLALGWTVVRIISTDLSKRVAEVLRQAGFGVTEMSGQGMRGTVAVLEAVVRRADLPKVLQIIDEVDGRPSSPSRRRAACTGWRLAK